jgi:myosin heavy subunit
MLRDLGEIHEALAATDLPSAVGFAVLEELELRQEVSEAKGEVTRLQNSYVHSMHLLLELKALKARVSKQIDPPTKAQLQENAFLARALQSTSMVEVPPELRHSALIELGEECQEAARTAAELQLTLEQYSALPPVSLTQNAELARARLEEAQTELESLEEEWNQAVLLVMTPATPDDSSKTSSTTNHGEPTRSRLSLWGKVPNKR